MTLLLGFAEVHEKLHLKLLVNCNSPHHHPEDNVKDFHLEVELWLEVEFLNGFLFF